VRRRRCEAGLAPHEASGGGRRAVRALHEQGWHGQAPPQDLGGLRQPCHRAQVRERMAWGGGARLLCAPMLAPPTQSSTQSQHTNHTQGRRPLRRVGGAAGGPEPRRVPRNRRGGALCGRGPHVRLRHRGGLRARAPAQ
jgi:hypothetical protein